MAALKLSWEKIKTQPGQRRQSGSALVPVLGVIIVSTIGILLAFQYNAQSQLYGYKGYFKKTALYIAESGVADVLYQLKYGDSSSAVDTGFLPLGSPDSLTSDYKAYPFFFNPKLEPAQIEVDRDDSYITVRSKGVFKSEQAEVTVVFGKSLSDSLLKAALILTGGEPLMEIFPDQVEGKIFTKKPPSIGIVDYKTLDAKWTLTSLTGEFVANLNKYFHSELSSHLLSEHGEIGNGYFSPGSPPDFKAKSEISFPLGDVTFENYQTDCWTIEGPGSIYANGDIYIKGCVRLVDVNIVAGRTIQANEQLKQAGGTIYSEGNMYIGGESEIRGTLLSEKSIFLEDEAQLGIEAVAISSGKETGLNELKDKVPGEVKLPNEFGVYGGEYAVLRGLVIADGNHGKIEILNSEKISEGYFLSKGDMDIRGEIHGMVVASQLRCSENKKENCLGDGKISRYKLTNEIPLPMAFGGDNMESFEFKLIKWVWN